MSAVLLPLLLFGTPSYEDAMAYAPIAYYQSDIDLGPLADPRSCYSIEDPNVVTALLLFNDEGLPLYEVFNKDGFELNGFEFRVPFEFTWRIPETDCLGVAVRYDGFCVMWRF